MLQYRTLSQYLSAIFPGKVRKIAVNAHLGCPGHCSYCNNRAFSPSYSIDSAKSISEQLRDGIAFNSSKAPVSGYLAFFQSYTNTYGDTVKLVSLYEEALSFPGVMGLVIATRPDCLNADLLEWMESRFGRRAGTGHPYLLVELGVESTNDCTLERVHRGHDWYCSERAILELDRRGINVGVHLIIGLPGEGMDDYITHVRRLSSLPVRTLKLHQLQIIRGTEMARQYAVHPEAFKLMTAEEYAAVILKLLSYLRQDIALDRFVSEAPPNMVIAPCWGLKPSEFNRLLDRMLLIS